MRAYYLAFVVFATLYGCSQPQTGETTQTVEFSDPRFPECPTCGPMVHLYYFADTVIRRNDTVFVVNKRLDTTVVETGIFTYMRSSYPVMTPDNLVQLIKEAVQAEKTGNFPQATKYYQAAVRFYQDDWTQRKGGFENGGIFDLNEYYESNVNITTLVSYAFEKLGRLPEAIQVLAPFLANSETYNSKIQQRYIELCIKYYGRNATQKALNASGKTVHRAQSSNEYCDWMVFVFGANLGVDFCTSPHYASDSLTQREAQCYIQQQPFYALVR